MDLKYQNLFSMSTGNKPTTSNLVRGEIALNLFDSKMFFRKVTNPDKEATDTIVEVDLTPASLAKLTDVQLSELNNGNVIVWDGTKWVNKAADSTLISDFVAKVKEIITGKVGTQLQAHSDQLDKVATLADEGLVFRKADGTIQGMTVEAADTSVTIATDAENKKVTVKLSATGTAGSYTKVTTDAQGRVTAGENPNTLEGYGIVDALNIAGGTLTGVTKYSAVVAEAGYDEDTLVAKKYVDKKAADAAKAELTGKQGETVKLINDKLEVASGAGNNGKVLTAGEDGQAATWRAVDFSNFVTLDGAQTIDGVKTFSEVITANKGLTATGDSISVNSKKLSSLAAPTADTDAATKAYVDALKQGLVVKSPVRAATTANIDATYANGTAGVGAMLTGAANGALAAIDDVTLAVGQRVLVKNQTDAKQNGIYVVTKIGSGTEAFVLTRASDFDNSVEGSVQGGAYCFIQEGTVNADCGYVCSTDGDIVLGTSSVTFVQFSGAGLITAGNGLVKDGNTLSAKGVANQITVTEGGIGIDPKYQEFITKLGTITQGVWNGTAVDVAYGGTGATTKEAGFAALAPAGANKGDLMYFDGTKWVALAKGEGVLVADKNGVSYQTKLAAGTF